MRNFLFLIMATVFFTSSIQAQEKMDSVSYSLGVLMAQNLVGQGFDEIDGAILGRAMEHVLQGKDLEIDLNTANTIVQEHAQKMQAVVEAQQAEKYKAVKEEGAAFLAKNAERAEVKTTASGLQYEVLEAGSGVLPTPSDQVQVHYTGKLIDGTVFDSSVERGQPATFGVTQVIQGWVEGLQLMKEGAKYRFYIPFDLAYGTRGAGPQIGPYSTLIFDVELLKVNP